MTRYGIRRLAALTAAGMASTCLAGCWLAPGDAGAGGPGSTSTVSPAADQPGAPGESQGPAGDGGGTTSPAPSLDAPEPGSPSAPPASSIPSAPTGSSAPSSAPAPSSPSAPGGQPTTGAPTAPQEPTTSPAPGSGAGHDQSQAQIEGWSIDFFDGFDTPLEQTKWERYGWGDPPVGHGAMGVMSQRNSFTRDGNLVIRTQYENGQWSAGGAGSKFVHTASYGRWEVRAKFPQAKGIGYAFLLWPADEGWPPEIDFAEGRVNGPQVMGVYHWDPDNKQEHRFMDHHDMSGWHTYGVIVEPNLITFTLDGQPWGTIEHPSVTDKQMFIGFQTGAMDPNGWQSNTETVDGGVPGPLTPAVSDIEIDYVAHYTRN
ncbi:MAG: family 16 glycosylhydrolase [Actinomyces bowdenii]|nr:family 16 glycosylhydrolase [Actinomyces bowdenii]